MRLPGEALGLRLGAADFEAEVVRVYDNFVENELDTTKTEATVAIPMAASVERALGLLLEPTPRFELGTPTLREWCSTS